MVGAGEHLPAGLAEEWAEAEAAHEEEEGGGEEGGEDCEFEERGEAERGGENDG